MTEEQPKQEKPAASNCRDCVYRVQERVRQLVPLVVLRERFAEPAIHAACEMFYSNNMGSLEPSVKDCASYKQVSAEFVLSSAATGKWAQLDILADSELRFVLPMDASADDEEVCRSWALALEFCRTHDDGMVVVNAFIAKQVAPIPPSPIVTFPASASYIGEHVRRYVLKDGGKVLLQRHELGAGTLYVCVESASHGLLLLLRDTFAGMMSALMATRAAAAEFCPQDPDYPDFWQPQIAVCVLSRTAAPVIFGALHGLPFPGEDSISPNGERVDTKNRKTFTRELAETFPDPLAKEIALASLAHQELAAKKG